MPFHVGLAGGRTCSSMRDSLEGESTIQCGNRGRESVPFNAGLLRGRACSSLRESRERERAIQCGPCERESVPFNVRLAGGRACHSMRDSREGERAIQYGTCERVYHSIWDLREGKRERESERMRERDLQRYQLSLVPYHKDATKIRGAF